MRPAYIDKLNAYRQLVNEGWPAANLDFSDQAAKALFEYESTGSGSVDNTNGFYVGKKWFDWNVSFLKDEVSSFRTTNDELRSDNSIPAALLRAVER